MHLQNKISGSQRGAQFCALLLALFIFQFTVAQELTNTLLRYRPKNPQATFVDSLSQFNLPSWRLEGEHTRINILYLLHKPEEELSGFLDFEQRLDKEQMTQLSLIQITQEDSLYLAFQKVSATSLRWRSTQPNHDSELHIYLNKQLLGILDISVFEHRRERVVVVPLFDFDLNENAINRSLNRIFESYNVSFDVHLTPSFHSTELEREPKLNNPSAEYDHYTKQMRHIRDAYFKTFPKSNKKSYYVFVHQGFINPELNSYAVHGKALSFVKFENNEALAQNIAMELGRGMGGLQKPSANDPKREENLMYGQGGSWLNKDQWKKLHLNFRGYIYFDEDEEVNTYNGFVAYYFWEENEDGTIVFNPGAFRNALQRPYKKNYFSYHLSIEKRLFKPLFSWMSYPLSPLHLILFGLYVALAFWLRRKWMRRITVVAQRKFKIQKTFIRIFLGIGVASLTLITFSTINNILARYEILEGAIPDFRGLHVEDVRKQIVNNTEIRRSAAPEMASEVLIKRGKEWYVKRRKRVLYFDLYKDSDGVYSIARFNRESDSIVIESEGIALLAPSHYFVINRINENQQYERQSVFNHQGSNVTNLLNFSDEPAKRILLFVNGYRPTSLGNSLEDNFRDIRERGIEYPNSVNLIYNFDRYEYWRPWREIDLQFERRINPSESYYADGHFSVNTSNYRSLIHFTQISKRYPTRCPNPNKHVCQHQGRTSWFRSASDETHHLLPNRPNYTGFKERRENGRIAGLNLLQQLNEIPNSSHNDTLYIVAHSMGYAYALGIVEEMRGKIHFGGFYILAPENASVGYVNPNEWKEIWQYGVNHQALKKTAPCMLDGVAPQTLAGGLEAKHHVFTPETLYRRFGFFDSHFVGFYDWILEIPKGEKGYIEQR